jgi:hypothetical protein
VNASIEVKKQMHGVVKSLIFLYFGKVARQKAYRVFYFILFIWKSGSFGNVDMSCSLDFENSPNDGPIVEGRV